MSIAMETVSTVAPIHVEVRSFFLSAIPVLAKNVNVHTTVPILSNLLVESDGAQITLRSTDLETSVSTSCGQTVTEPFAFTVNAKQFAEAVKGAKEARLTVEPLRVTVDANGARTVLQTLPANEFPPMTQAKTDHASAYLPFANLLSALNVAYASASKEEARGAVLMSAYVEMKSVPILTNQKALVITGTDGYRLTSATVDNVIVEKADGKGGAFILPRSVLPILRSIPDAKTSDVTITADERLATFTVAGFSVTVRLVDGQYPNYRQVLPAKITELPGFVVEAGAFADVIKQAAKVAGKEAYMVHVSPTFNGDVFVKAQAKDDGQTFERIVQCPCTLDKPTAFNGKYLAEILGTFEKKTRVRIVQAGPLSPAVAYDDVARDTVAVLMPLRK